MSAGLTTVLGTGLVVVLLTVTGVDGLAAWLCAVWMGAAMMARLVSAAHTAVPNGLGHVSPLSCAAN